MSRFTVFIVITLAFFTRLVQAQEPVHAVPFEEENQLIIESLDSMTNLYFKAIAAKPEPTLVSNEIPNFSDSVYVQRLNALNSMVPLAYNEQVRKFIELYVIRRRSQVQRMLGLSEIYFPIFEETLDKYNIPLELKYLAIIESALNPHAVSRRGATGLWQFMYSTGKAYGLKVNSYIDERRDPYKSTDAAARYLRDLYLLYGDWILVIAAYNSGPGNVNKAIRRSGGQTNFWDIRRHLPRETRGYVPAYVAATYSMNYYKEHNIYPVSSGIDLSVLDTVHITQRTSFETISKFTDMPVEEIAFLNPTYKKGLIPNGSYPLRLPLTKIAMFDMHKDSIYAQSPKAADPVILTSSSSSSSAGSTSSNKYYTPPCNDENKTRLIYTIKSGDNLGFIAEWYDCKAQDIRNCNDIYGSRIRSGQKLDIYVPTASLSKYQHIEQMSFSEKQAIEQRQRGTKIASAPSNKQNSSAGYAKHKVRYGDTLWDIARMYPGNTIEGLKKLNNIENGRGLKPGDILKVQVPGPSSR